MPLKVVHTQKIDKVIAQKWQGQAVYNLYPKLTIFLKKSLGEKYSQLFSRPSISDAAIEGYAMANWTSELFTTVAQPLTALPEDEQKHYLQVATELLSELFIFSKKLRKSEKQEEREWGEIINLSIQIPTNDHILVENYKILFVVWGFRQLNGYSITGDITKNLEGITEIDKIEDKADSVNEEDKSIDIPELSGKQGIMIPVDPTKIIVDPETGRTIVSNRLNLIFKGENKNIAQFIKRFKEIFPDQELKITYYDKITHRIQIEISNESRIKLKKDLLEKLPEFDLIIIPESIFKGFNEQTNFNLEDKKKSWHHEMIKTFGAWEIDKGNPELVVAIIDDGFDLEHRFFDNRIYKPQNVCNKSSIISPSLGHGTHVAGLAIGKDSESNISGVAPDCKFMPVQAANEENLISTTAIVDGILYAVYNGASVINISLGAPFDKRYESLSEKELRNFVETKLKDEEFFWEEIFSIAYKNNVTIVLAAGNFNTMIGLDPMQRSKKTIKVSAVDMLGNKADFSNYGRLSTLSAPGVQIYSSLPGNQFDYKDGTSMSAPLVTGAVALLKSRYNTITFQQIVYHLQTTGIPVNSKSKYIGNIIQLDKPFDENKNETPLPPIEDDKIENDDEKPLDGDTKGKSPKSGNGGNGNSNDSETGGELGEGNGNTGDSGTGNNSGSTEDGSRDSNRKKGIFSKLGFNKGCLGTLLLFLLLLLLIFLLLHYCNRQSDILPPSPGIIPPIDTTKIIKDPDSVRLIISNKINIALKGKNKNVFEFAKVFKEIYPGKEYRIVYYDTVICRVQIEVPANERVRIKNELKRKITNFEMLIWDESLFKGKYIPTDPGFSNVEQYWYLKMIRAFEAWDYSMGDTSIIIAIIDNGIDLAHPEFKGKIIKPWNPMTRLTDVGVTWNKRCPEHGTHVAGIATALSDNGNGVSGIAPHCKLMPIKVSDKKGYISNTAVIDAVFYAIYHNANVINLSLGMDFAPDLSKSLTKQKNAENLFKDEEEFWNELFEMAYQKNTVIVLAAGNENMLIGVDPMQRSKNTIIVSAVDFKQERAAFSNYGKRSTISAPGVHIYNSVAGKGYSYLDGTSMAAPIVTGAIALIKSINPAMPFDEMVNIIQTTGIPVNSPGKYVGNIIQLNAVVEAAQKSRLKQPHVGCPEIQKKIDSLLFEIEKLKKICKDKKAPTGDTMKIPPKPVNLNFAEGNWKSTSEITSFATKEKVVLYFEISKNGSGTLTLEHPSGMKCKAPLDIVLKKSKVIINQTSEAICDVKNVGYVPYYFECEAGENGVAECWTENKTDKKNNFRFNLIKIK
jgi:subtilisin family serine protease